jgi:hypothetical protein
MVQDNLTINLLECKFFNENKEKADSWVLTQKNITNKNEKFNLKVNDTITFMGGYNRDIIYTSKIFAFNSENGNAYVYWDCYWFDLNLEERLVKPKDEITITEKIIKLNDKANSISSVKNTIIETIQYLNKNKTVSFGYRSSCGSTDNTMEIYKLWLKLLKELEKQNVYLKSKSIIVSNSSPTSAKGFWNEIEYRF